MIRKYWYWAALVKAWRKKQPLWCHLLSVALLKNTYFFYDIREAARGKLLTSSLPFPIKRKVHLLKNSRKAHSSPLLPKDFLVTRWFTGSLSVVENCSTSKQHMRKSPCELSWKLVHRKNFVIETCYTNIEHSEWSQRNAEAVKKETQHLIRQQVNCSAYLQTSKVKTTHIYLIFV